jgi:hypothetical protein
MAERAVALKTLFSCQQIIHIAIYKKISKASTIR